MGLVETFTNISIEEQIQKVCNEINVKLELIHKYDSEEKYDEADYLRQQIAELKSEWFKWRKLLKED